jgi:hypothetical protein
MRPGRASKLGIPHLIQVWTVRVSGVVPAVRPGVFRVGSPPPSFPLMTVPVQVIDADQDIFLATPKTANEHRFLSLAKDCCSILRRPLVRLRRHDGPPRAL